MFEHLRNWRDGWRPSLPLMAAGASLERPLQDEFYGERSGVVRDPFGHRWNIGHSIEEMPPEEMQRRYTAFMQGQGA